MRKRFDNILIVHRLIILLSLFLTCTVIIPYHVVALTSIVGVYSSYGMSASIMDDGTVYAWGNGNPTPTQVSGLIDIKSVCLPFSGDFSALKNDGTVWVWKEDGSTAAQVQGLTDVKKIIDARTGLGTTYALKDDGTVWAFISNGSPYTPVQVQDLTNVKDLTINTALKNDGTVWEWGVRSDYYDNATYFSKSDIIQIIGLDNVASIFNDGLIMKSDGTIWQWGYNYSRLWGNIGFTGTNTTPYQVPITDVKKISGNDEFFAALKNDGTVWAWGYDSFGELGNSVPHTTSAPFVRNNMPVQIDGLSNIVDIAAGSSAAIALGSDGTVLAWGDNTAGTLGVDAKSGISLSSTPMKISVIKNVNSVYMGDYTCYALENDGSLWAWGANDHGQIGDGTLGDPVYSHGEKVPPVKVLIDSSAAKTPTITSSPTVTPLTSTNSSAVSSTPEASGIVETHLDSPTASTTSSSVLSIVGIAVAIVSIIIVVGGAIYLFVFRKR